jgi:hypothetical protein
VNNHEQGAPPRGGGNAPFNSAQASRAEHNTDSKFLLKTQGERYPDAPGYKDDGAGREAAEAFRPKVACRRQEVFNSLANEPETADVIASRIGRPVYHTRPRLTELLARGLAVKAEGRGISDFGAPATLWRRATSEERAIAAARRAAEAEHGEAA